MPSNTVPTDSGVQQGAKIAIPLISLCCLGTVLFLVASTIVLALIPIYLSTRSMTAVPQNSPRYAVFGMSQSLPAYGNATTSSCNSLTSAMSSATNIQTGGLTGNACSVAVQSRRRRRRSRYNYRAAYRTSNRIYVTLTINFVKCPRCLLNSYMQGLIGTSFTIPFFYYGTTYTITFTLISFGTSGFGTLSTDVSTVATTASGATTTTTPSATSNVMSG